MTYVPGVADSLSSLIGARNYYSQIIPAARAASASDEVQQEFLTIFYKELLKQAFKMPDLSPVENEEEQNRLFPAFNQDMMVEQFAKELARNSSASLGLMNKWQ